jgi:hypothetical protein
VPLFFPSLLFVQRINVGDEACTHLDLAFKATKLGFVSGKIKNVSIS